VTCESSHYGGILLGYAHNDKDMFNGNRTIKLECLEGSKLGSLRQIGFTPPGKTSGCGLVTKNPEKMEEYFDPQYSISANTNFALKEGLGKAQQLHPLFIEDETIFGPPIEPDKNLKNLAKLWGKKIDSYKFLERTALL
jgi:hypothetical protein